MRVYMIERDMFLTISGEPLDRDYNTILKYREEINNPNNAEYAEMIKRAKNNLTIRVHDAIREATGINTILTFVRSTDKDEKTGKYKYKIEQFPLKACNVVFDIEKDENGKWYFEIEDSLYEEYKIDESEICFGNPN